MTDTTTRPKAAPGQAPMDVFAAARWFEDLWNSTARAVSAELIEWRCRTWGSGRGGGAWTETALFRVVAETFGLQTDRDREERDELVIQVPLDRVPGIVGLVGRIGQEPEDWPWLIDFEDFEDEDDERQGNAGNTGGSVEDEEAARLAVAAQVLATTPEALAANPDLLEALGLT